MREKFVEELKKLKSDVVEMAMLSKEMLKESLDALKTSDITIAEKVISQRRDIREYDYKIEDDAQRLIVLYQPVARDLRAIISTLKMNTYLTRIGIYSKDISKDIREISFNKEFPRLKSVIVMGDIVLGMLDDVIKAYETEDLTIIDDMWKVDDTVDDLFHTILRECISYMIENPRSISYYTHYMLIARYLERCGDHVCKISEKIHYMVNGERIIIK
ncbi:MAG: transcriptional regulator PhoU [Candidatus Methanofastidiosum methylothiophilum]|uniref:Phosphate-specific transport system accessory protein PhoU n=1 Tax=Candidatus Methanofastidiosum methylothiophilum TaxID=1705564 RepID=A0A150IXR6_9EURY|nr:MAG: transcriptional regulator PhoU [Candidatus Methanofastidiosum methylthiophilus]KYC47335.1 MAG: transcriptional regulator PhoU [Candidatus Methanofastidiosum methylthiophilus]KYC49786.1 MAG: transcriptional regulator PhoU [Candidatus Methanofastidiosum methylthiophilus]